MTDPRRGSPNEMSPLEHSDAEALISARLDGPLDPVMNRTLLAHLASCDSCRAFANQMDAMATAVRAIPSLPPSAAVSRNVRSEIRGQSRPIKRFGNWISTSKSAPLSALAAAAVVLALVSASVFGPLGDDNGNGSSVNAPEFAAVESATGSAGDTAPTGETSQTYEESAGEFPNVQVTQTAPSSAAALPTGEPVEGGAEASDQNAGDSSGSAPTDASEDTGGESGSGEAAASGATGNEANAAASSSGDEAGLGDGTGGSNFPIEIASEGESADPTATSEPAPTEVPAATETPEPTATEPPAPTETIEPTATEEPAPTETLEPTATEETEPTEIPATPTLAPATPTATPATPEPMATNTPEPTATDEPEPTETPEPSPTATEEPGEESDSPVIVPRGGDEPSESQESGSAADSSSNASTITSRTDDDGANEGEGGTGSADSTAIQQADLSEETATDEAEASLQQATDSESAPQASGPVTFGELTEVGVMGTSGLLLPGNGGYYAAERAGGGLTIVGSDGSVIVSGWGYNPVWSEDGQTLYAADGSLSESGSALISWNPGGGPTYVTTGEPVFDTPAGAADGGLYFVRYQPGAEFSLQLRFTGGDDRVVWESGAYTLIGQAIYLYGGEVFIPTDQGWIAVPTGGGEPRNVGSVMGGEYDLLIDYATGMLAYVSNGSVYMAPAASPGSAMFAGEIGNGGLVWTPYGLALANGSQVTIITFDGVSMPVVSDGLDLTAPVWGSDGLRIADAGQGGVVRILPAGGIAALIGG